MNKILSSPIAVPAFTTDVDMSVVQLDGFLSILLDVSGPRLGGHRLK